MTQFDQEYTYDFGRFEEPSDNTALVRQAQRGDVDAREEAVCGNLPLVATIAMQYRRLGLDLEDLIQEGGMGLMLAVERFDPDRGTELSTYATHWIKQYIRRALENTGGRRPYRVPVYVYSHIRAIGQARRDLEGQLMRPATETELWDHIERESKRPAIEQRYSARLMSSTREQFLQVLETACHTCQSNDIPSQPDAGVHAWLERASDLGDRVEERWRARKQLAQDGGLAARMIEAIRQLPDKKRIVIVRRYGLHRSEPEAMRAVAKHAGCTFQCVGKIEARALQDLAKSLKCSPDLVQSALLHLEDLCTFMHIDLETACLLPAAVLPTDAPTTPSPDTETCFRTLCEHLICLPTGARNVGAPLKVLAERLRMGAEQGWAALAELKSQGLVDGDEPWLALRIIPEIAEPRYPMYK